MQYVLSDIHGNGKRFDSVLAQISLQPEDTLYVLGDVADRYPDGIRILKQLMAMPNMKMLLGNHEYMLLDVMDTAYDFSDPFEEQLYASRLSRWYRNGGQVTQMALLAEEEESRDQILRFLRSLPLSFDTEAGGVRYRLIHGGEAKDWKGTEPNLRDAVEYAVWHRISPGEEEPADYVQVFGHTHTSHYAESDPLRIWHSPGGHRIGIDCGCSFPPADLTGPEGRLACLRLDDGKEFYSEM